MTKPVVNIERILFEKLRASDAILHMALERDGTLFSVSQNCTSFFLKSSFDLVKQNFIDLPLMVVNDDGVLVSLSDHPLKEMIETSELKSQFSVRFQNLDKVTYKFDIEFSVQLVDGRDVVILLLIDKSDSLKLGALNNLYYQALNASHEAVVITDSTPEIIEVNPAFTLITGYEREEVIGKNPSILSSGAQNKHFYTEFWHTLKSEGCWQGAIINRKKSGELYSEQMSIQAVKDADGSVTNYLSIFTELTTRSKEMSPEEQRLASLDALTALPMRTILIDRLEQSIGYAHRHDLSVAVIYIDIDFLKAINDEYGHSIGDEVIKAVAKRLKVCIRSEDTLSRYGGDEFVLILRDLNVDFDLDQFINRLSYTIKTPIIIDDKEISITSSMGITRYPEDDSTAETLIRHADYSMGIAKAHGRSKHVFFSKKKEIDHAKANEERELLLTAIAQDELELYAQPQFDVRENRLYGLELLVRWNSPDRGLVYPDQFLNTLKDNDLLEQIDRWVVAKAVSIAGEKLGFILEDSVKIGINLTPASLQSKEFHEWANSILSVTDASIVKRIEFEIIENDALENLAQVVDLIAELKKYGVSFSLDDFGTGYSSLGIFNQLPVDTIKVDQTFVSQMVDDHRNLSLIKAICEMSRIFERNIIAEGVEVEEQASLLSNLGCDVIQGYGLARPMPIDNFVAWVEEFKLEEGWLTKS